MWNIIKQEIHKVRDKYVTELEKKRPSPIPPWMTKKIRRSVKKKYKLWKRVERTGRNKEYKEYKQQCNEYNIMRKDAKRQYEKKLVRKFKDKPKLFYGYVRSKLKVKPVVTNLTKPDGTSTDNDEEVTEVLSEFFRSVFTEEGDEPLPAFQDRVNQDNTLADITITKEDVEKKLRNLKEDKAGGPDDINPMVLKRCAESLSKKGHRPVGYTGGWEVLIRIRRVTALHTCFDIYAALRVFLEHLEPGLS